MPRLTVEPSGPSTINPAAMFSTARSSIRWRRRFGPLSLSTGVAAAPSVAIYDPAGYFMDFAAVHDLSRWRVAGLYVQRIEEVGQRVRRVHRQTAHQSLRRPVRRFCSSPISTAALISRGSGPYRPAASRVESFDSLRLPKEWLTIPERYLEPLNFVSDFIFFRDEDGLHTSVSTINYWHERGARHTRLWCRLFNGVGRRYRIVGSADRSVATVRHRAGNSQTVRRRFGYFTTILPDRCSSSCDRGDRARCHAQIRGRRP